MTGDHVGRFKARRLKSDRVHSGGYDRRREGRRSKNRQLYRGEKVGWLCPVHPYDVPEILATPVIAGSQSYLTWLNSELKASAWKEEGKQ
jgi:hypothetical protein